MSTTPLRLSLLDYLGYRVRCACLSDLRVLEAARQACLADVVEELAPEDAPLSEWNETLSYLSGQEARASTALQARLELLAWLRKQKQ